MKVEIWSDVVCPFCYIGKRKFEKALDQFGNKDNVEIVWRSFQLDPDLKPVPGQSVHEYLAKRKGVSLAEGKEMNKYMTSVAEEVGLQYDFDKAVITNTLDAHRLIHFAKDKGLQGEMKENLFKAYYTEGKDIGDHQTLVDLGVSTGLDADEVAEVLQSERYVEDVRQDQYQAQQVGARGVPFYVFNDKYAVSGAQPTELFSEVLNKVQEEEMVLINKGQGDAGFCGPDGKCD